MSRQFYLILCIVILTFSMFAFAVAYSFSQKTIVDKEAQIEILKTENANLQRTLNSEMPTIDTTLPSLALNIEVADGIIGQWTTVLITSSKFRDDCTPKTARFIRAQGTTEEHQVIDSTRSERDVAKKSPFLITQYQIKIPESVPEGPVEFQSRTTFTCPDGEVFRSATPWAKFVVTR